MNKKATQEEDSKEKNTLMGKHRGTITNEISNPSHNTFTGEKIWGEDLDVYPLRKPGDDPRWAVRTVWVWVGFGLFSLVFIIIFLILGAFYD